MKAFVIAGGEGTRLKPYTYTCPKPMLRVGGKPIIEYVIGNLKKAGIKDIILTTGYLHEQIEKHLGNGSKFGVNIEYSVEKEKRNTAGSILPYKGKIKGEFLVVMGDHITNIDLKEMIKQHNNSKAIATLALLKKKNPLEYGIAEVENGKIKGFSEKPLHEHLYNIAIYAFDQVVFDYIREGDDFAKDVFPRMLKDKARMEPYIFEGVWYDIGRVPDYHRIDEIMNMVKLAKDLE